MSEWKSAVETKEAELIGKGIRADRAHTIALKRCRSLHPSHKTATARRIEAADTAQAMTGEFHQM